ncbi:MAG: S9 family peptidase [Candidatus Zhuqueibacterota bacterium]
MSRISRHAFFQTILVAVILSFISGLAQEKKTITVEWIFSAESRKIATVPLCLWLEDGSALVYDTRIPMEKRTFERLDPRTGMRTPLLDREKAIASAASVLREDRAPKFIMWPTSFDATGRQAIYLVDGDIYLLDVVNAQFRRITESPAEEKCVNFSPDGRSLAFVRDNDLYVHTIAAGVEKRLTRDGTETLLNGTLSWVYWEEIFGRQDIGYWWSNDSRDIAFLQTDESMVSLMHYVDVQPDVPRVLTQRYPKAGGVNPKVRVGMIEIETGRTTWVKLDEAQWEYIARVNWLPDNRQLSVQTMNREQTELDIYFADRFNGNARHILKETDNAWVNIHDELLFLKQEKSFIWSSEQDGYAHLYRYTWDGKLVNQITKGDWAVRASAGVYWLRQAIAAVDEKSGWVYFTSLKESSLEKHLYRIKLNGSNLQKITRAAGTHGINFRPDGKYFFDTYSTIGTPPSLALYKNDGQLVTLLAASNTELAAGYDLQYPELFTVPTRDGFPMPASLLKPKNFDPSRKYPIIFNVYGGPSAPTVANSWSFSIYSDQILLDNGFLVASLDNRSATAISKILENRIYKKMMGDDELNDLVDGVKWFKSLPYVDPERVGIWGWSGGGTYTLLGMTKSEEFKAGIAVAAVTDWHFYDTKWAETVMKTPEANPEGYESTSLLRSAKNLHGRLLLVHGSYDDNVHIQNAWRFTDELIKANKMFDMMIYPMRQHGISDLPARIHLYSRMLEFWQRNL